jgi:hypothetical protein
VFAACSAGGTPNHDDPGNVGTPQTMSDGGLPTCVTPRAPETFDAVRIAVVSGTGGYPTIRIGPDGVPVVAFVAGDPGQEQIVAIRIDGATASGAAAPVVPLSQSGRTVTPPRLAATRDGRIAGAYVSNTGDTYSTRSLAWSGEAADAPVDTLPFADLSGLTSPAVVLGSDDRPIVAAAYADNSLRLLRSLPDGSWSRETVEIGFLPFEDTLIDLALDPDGRPVLVASRMPCSGICRSDTSWLPSDHGLTVWRRDGGSWTKDRLVPDEVHLQPRILSSPTGELSIFYGGVHGLARAVRHGDDWVVEDPLADGAGRTASPNLTDVAFGPQGELHVVAAGFYGLEHDVLDGCGWSVTIIGEGENPAIAVDQTGRPVMAYQNAAAFDANGNATTIEIWYVGPRS